VLHGAGIQVSGRLDRKDPAQFWQIIDTKLGGLRSILRALDAEGCPPPHVHLATSAFSFFGNDGQEDYGAANEALNRLAEVQAARSAAGGPSWSSMAWLAWDGIGMTRGSEYRTLARQRRMRGLRGPEGAELLARLLGGRPRAGANVLMSDLERDRYGIDVVRPRQHVVAWELDWQCPALREHRVNGRPTHPACLSIVHMVAVARSLVPEATPVAVEDCRLERPLGAKITTARACARILPCGPEGARVAVWIEADRRTADGQVVRERERFASCCVRFGKGVPPTPTTNGRTPEPAGEPADDPYLDPEAAVSLGPSYDCLRDVRLSPAVNTARLVAPADGRSPLVQGTPLPIAVDALLRLAVLHREAAGLPVYVPVRIASIVWHGEGAFEGASGFALSCTSPAVTGDRVHCASAVARDARGKNVLEMTQITGHRLGQLTPARRAALAAAAPAWSSRRNADDRV
jgi:hypothetical protein